MLEDKNGLTELCLCGDGYYMDGSLEYQGKKYYHLNSILRHINGISVFTYDFFFFFTFVFAFLLGMAY